MKTRISTSKLNTKNTTVSSFEQQKMTTEQKIILSLGNQNSNNTCSWSTKGALIVKNKKHKQVAAMFKNHGENPKTNKYQSNSKLTMTT